MPNTTQCYLTTSKDEEVAKLMYGDSEDGALVANIRGMYDTEHPTEMLDIDALSAEEIKDILKAFNKQRAVDRAGKIHESYTHLSKTLKQLSAEFPSTRIRNYRINTIVNLFSLIVDSYAEQNPGLSRETIIKGFKDVNGEPHLGEAQIFEEVRNEIVKEYQAALEDGVQEDIEAFEKFLRNWPALVSYARTKIKNTEGVKLGGKYEYAENTDENDYGQNDLTELFNEAMSVKDGWMSKNELKSPYSSIGTIVRRYLSRVPEVEWNADTKQFEPKVDDLGFTIYKDPTAAHNVISGLIQSCLTSTDMINTLKWALEHTSNVEWLESVIADLESDPQLRTRFFVDFCGKNNQKYSKLKVTFKNGVRKFTYYIENKLISNADTFGKFMLRAAKGIGYQNYTIFDGNGNIGSEQVQRMQEVSDAIEKLVGSQGEDKGSVQRLFNRKIDRQVRAQELINIMGRLGIQMSLEDAENLITNKKAKARQLAKHLLDLSKFGFDKTSLNKLATRTSRQPVRFSKWMSTKVDGKDNIYAEKFKKIIKIINETSVSEKSYTNACKTKNAKGKTVTMYSTVNACYMADEIERFQRYVSLGDQKGLRQYIREKYLCDPVFYKDGKILCKWLDDLYNSKYIKTKEGDGYFDPDSFAANLDYDRFLGAESQDMKVFENFTARDHAISLLGLYIGEGTTNAGKYALYPTFILGDSGVSKNIRAKRYITKGKEGLKGTEDIVDGMYNVFLQEIERKKKSDAITAKLQKIEEDEGKHFYDEDGRGHSVVSYKRKTALSEKIPGEDNGFVQLPFLNPNFVSSDGQVGKYIRMLGEGDVYTASEDLVKNAIRAYMNDAAADFVSKLKNMKVIDTESKLADAVKGKKEDKVKALEELATAFFWDTKFATMQQIQMMTIDPAFYASTKELQKRYKEIHAPGTKLDVRAEDFKGERYAKNKYMTCLYFNDISQNAEDTNMEFMDAIAYQYGMKSLREQLAKGTISEEDINSMDADGIREVGRETDTYNMYKKNTLTDGQGYRTLKSYRKVMGMAGQWTEEMEKAYDTINEISAKYEGTGQTITGADLDEINKLAVVFQPLKPYMYTFEKLPLNGNQAALIPVQLKYSEAILIPALLPEGRLKDAAKYMEANDIDVLASNFTVKTGEFGTTDISDENVPIEKALSNGYVHKLSYEDYRIQTNVPYHSDHTRLFGTQIRKLIMSALNQDLNDYHYSSYFGNIDKINLGDGVEIRGDKVNSKNLVTLYNSLIVSNIVDAFNQFDNSVDSIEDVSDLLMQSLINNDRQSLDNILAFALTSEEIDGVLETSTPLFEGGVEHDAAALIFSVFKKLVNKQSIEGGSLVQASAFGITTKEYVDGSETKRPLRMITNEDRTNILYAECEVPFDFVFKDSNGKDVSLDFNEYCHEDGELKRDSDGVALIEKDFPGILDMVAYRIPTERDYSMLNLKIARFSKKTEGGTIKVPVQCTTIAGFDFDIDKLYFMKKSFEVQDSYYESYTDEEKDRIFSHIYSQRPDILNMLTQLRGTEKKSLNSYWDKMLATYPSIAEDSSYNKDKLFNAAARELGIIKEKKVVWDDYDFNKSPYQNSKTARNNLLVEIIRQRLMDVETFEQRTTPGGFPTATDAARFMRELEFTNLSIITDSSGKVNFSAVLDRCKDSSMDPEPNYDPSDPMTLITYNQQNQVAGKLIGIFANQNTNHAFASLMKKFELKKPISFGSHTGKKALGNLLSYNQGTDVTLAELLAASVDAVKDPVLNFLNLNTVTADAAALLGRLGFSFQEIGLLFNQRIIKEVCEECLEDGTPVEDVIARVKNQYSQGITRTPVELTEQVLADSLIENRKGAETLSNNFKNTQLAVLDIFTQIQKASAEISEFVSATKFTAANAVGSTFGDMYSQQMRIDKYLSKLGDEKAKTSLSLVMEVSDFSKNPISKSETIDTLLANLKSNPEAYVNHFMDNPFAYENAMYDMNRKMVQTLNEKYYPYDTKIYREIRTTLANLTKYGVLDAETINQFHSDYIVKVLSSYEGSPFDGDAIRYEVDGKAVTNREWYLNIFPGQIAAVVALAKMNGESNALFDSINFTLDDDGEVTGITINGIGGQERYEKDEIKDAWRDLLNSPIGDHRNMASDLFMYCYYKLGFQFSPKTFMDMCPNDVKEQIGFLDAEDNEITYFDVLKNIKKGELKDYGIVIDSKDVAIQFMLNHTDNYKFCWRPYNKNVNDILKGFAIKRGSKLEDSFVLDLGSIDKSYQSYFIQKTEDKTTFFKPCIIIEGEAYIADNGNPSNWNASNGNTMTYYHYPTLGKTASSMQYHSSISAISSRVATDNNKAQDSSEDEVVNIPGTDAVPEGFNGTNLDTKERVIALQNEIVRLCINMYKDAYDNASEDEKAAFENNIYREFQEASVSDLVNTIEEIKRKAVENGIDVMDAEGEPTRSC
jgi:hypothetical protein